jgi:hypothetical protein
MMNDLTLLVALQILQVSIAPVVWISGVGLLILTQTNRMSHLMDRVRYLQAQNRKEPDPDARKQVALLFARAKIIRISLIALLVSILFDVLLIVTVFTFKAFNFDNGFWVIFLFSMSLLALIVGVIAYIVEVNKNLNALSVEVGEDR